MEGNGGLEIQVHIVNLLQERAELVGYLREMVVWEEHNPPKGLDDTWSGWEWQDVHTAPGVINYFISQGIVDMRSKSRSYAHYRLHSLPATKAAISNLSVSLLEERHLQPEELFSLVVGHDKAKAVLQYAVLAEKPVHVLLAGPPGTAKTLMLSDLGMLPGAQYYVGSTTTKSGLVGLLLVAKPRYLIIDELDKMAEVDMSPLLNLMETGMVTRLQHNVRERVGVDCRVFAGANETKKLPAAIMSRFAVFDIPPYSPKEFVRVATQVLIQREGVGPEVAKHISNEVVKYSTDVRAAVRVARMARGDPQRVLDVIRCLWSGERPAPTGQTAPMFSTRLRV